MSENSQFDAERQRREAEQMRKLKKSNLQAVFGTGAGRLAIFAVALAMVGMIGFGLFNLFSAKAVERRAPPTEAMLGVTGRNGDPMAGNTAEANARVAQNAVEASAAAAQGKPYIAPPVLVASDAQGQQPVGADAMAPATQNQSTVATPSAQQQIAGTQAQGAGQRGGISDAQVAGSNGYGYRAVAASLAASEVAPQIDFVARGQDPTQRRPSTAYQMGYYPVDDALRNNASRGGVTQTVAQAGVQAGTGAATVPGSGDAAKSKRPIPGFRAGTAYYCKFSFGMNSDLPRKDAVAKCFGGAADGAVFLGKAEASAEGVANPGFTVTFDHLMLPGHPMIEVSAVAVDVGTMEENVADDVNSHGVVKFSELALAGLLKGIGQVAGMQQAQQTTQSIGNVSTSTFATLRPDMFQIVGGALGGVGNGIADYFQKKSDALKTTIKVWPSKDIGVVLLGDVTE
jgi:hypothetical protein